MTERPHMLLVAGTPMAVKRFSWGSLSIFELSILQVLQGLAPLDLLWVSFLPGFSEELLFSGALVPALGADWCGFALTHMMWRAETGTFC